MFEYLHFMLQLPYSDSCFKCENLIRQDSLCIAIVESISSLMALASYTVPIESQQTHLATCNEMGTPKY